MVLLPARPWDVPQAQLGVTGVHICLPHQTGRSPKTGSGLSPPCVLPYTGPSGRQEVLGGRVLEKGAHSMCARWSL